MHININILVRLYLNARFYNQSSVDLKRIMQCNTMMIERWTNKPSSKAWWSYL